MREGDDLSTFRELKSVVVTSKAKKGKKNSQSPDMDDKNAVKAESIAWTDAQGSILEDELNKLAHAGNAAVCALSLLDLEGLPKQVNLVILSLPYTQLTYMDVFGGDHIARCIATKAAKYTDTISPDRLLGGRKWVNFSLIHYPCH